MPPIDPKLLRRIPALRRGLTATGLLAAATALAIVAQAAALSYVLVGGIGGRFDAGALALAAGAFAVRSLLTWAQQVIAARTAAAVKLSLRGEVLAATGHRRPLWSGRAGETVTLVTRGVDGLDAYISGYLPQLCLAATVPVTILVVLAFNDWASLAVIAITLPLIPVFGVLIGWHTKAKTEKQWRTLSRLGGHFLDTVTGLSTLRIFGRAGAAAREVGRTAERYRHATMATLRVAFLSALVLELVATVAVALVAVPIGLRLLDGAMDLRTAFLILLLAPEVYLPLRAVGTQFHAAAEGMEATREALALVDEAAGERSSRGDAGEESSRVDEAAESPQLTSSPQEGAGRFDSAGVRPSSVRLGEEVGGPGTIDGLEIVGLTVTYDGRAEPALADVTATLPAGETVALVGPSGAGKTTLLNALMGFVAPTAGTMRLSGLRSSATAVERDGAGPMSMAERATAGPIPTAEHDTVGPISTAGTVGWDGPRPTAMAAEHATAGPIPTAGTVRLSDRRPADPTDETETPTDLDRWRRRIVWVPQRPHLFAASLADNIRLGQPDASHSAVVAAATAAHAVEFIDELPDGYDTPLGADGFGLSAGQSRRVALARAFLRLDRLDCPLVLLDEPTASLDAVSETLVAEATVRLLRGRTAIIVAHRPALVDLADRVWRVAAGRLVRTGTEVPV